MFQKIVFLFVLVGILITACGSVSTAVIGELGGIRKTGEQIQIEFYSAEGYQIFCKKLPTPPSLPDQAEAKVLSVEPGTIFMVREDCKLVKVIFYRFSDNREETIYYK